MIDVTYLHPMIVHFPIALLIAGFGFDVAGLFVNRDAFTKAGFYLLLLGAAGTIAALLSGEAAGEGVAEQGPLKIALERHETAATVTVWLAATTASLRVLLVLLRKYKGYFKAGVIGLYFAAVIAVGLTGHYGGKLVYENAAGVQLNLGIDFGATDMNAVQQENEHDDD